MITLPGACTYFFVNIDEGDDSKAVVVHFMFAGNFETEQVFFYICFICAIGRFSQQLMQRNCM